MTDRAIYAAILDGIFGNGSAKFDVSDQRSNNVLGALAHAKQFNEVKANFPARLRRLDAAIQINPQIRDDIVLAANRVAEGEWDGAYAELSALDYFFADSATGCADAELDRTVTAAETLGSEMGMSSANHDLAFASLGVALDTKMLSDKAGRILESVFDDYRKGNGIKSLSILPTYNLGEDFAIFQRSRKALLAELMQNVDVQARPTVFSSRVIPGLSYEFAWNAGVMASVSSYSPLEHARKHHRLLFSHAKKFSKVEPSVIVFVLHPWFSERALALYRDSGKTFAKEFCDRFFLDYIGSAALASTINTSFKTGITAGDVTRHLSGVIFLDDSSAQSESADDVNVSACFYWNPHALHPLDGSELDKSLKRRGALNLRQ